MLPSGHIGLCKTVFLLFCHGKRHSLERSAVEVEAFLTDLVVERKVPTSTQNQALTALLFLYKEVLLIDLRWLDNVTRPKQPR
jgi:hypothetical protein